MSVTHDAMGGPTHVIRVGESKPPAEDDLTHAHKKIEQLEAAKAKLEAEKAKLEAEKPGFFKRLQLKRQARKGKKAKAGKSRSTTVNTVNATSKKPRVKNPSSRSARLAAWEITRDDLVSEAYAEREEFLRIFRGDIVKPAELPYRLHWLKPRVMLYGLVMAINLIYVKLIWWAKKPLWCFIPRPGMVERWFRALKILRSVTIEETKFISMLSFKGGIGKTTLLLLMGIYTRLKHKTLVTIAEDCNRDHGTIGDRCRLTTDLSMQEAVAAVRSETGITRLSHLTRFCTRLSCGLYILTMSNPRQIMDPWKVSDNDLVILHAVMKNLVHVVFCDLGTSSDSPSNIAALADTNQLVLGTTPAKDSLKQCAKTFGWLYGSNAHNQFLAQHAIVTINRWWPFWWLFTRPTAVRRQFIEQLAESLAGPPSEEELKQETARCGGDAMKAVRRLMQQRRVPYLPEAEKLIERVHFVTISSSLWLTLGRVATHHVLSFPMRTQLMELNALALTGANRAGTHEPQLSLQIES